MLADNISTQPIHHAAFWVKETMTRRRTSATINLLRHHEMTQQAPVVTLVNCKLLHLSKLEAFADDNLRMAKAVSFVFERYRKGEKKTFYFCFSFQKMFSSLIP